MDQFESVEVTSEKKGEKVLRVNLKSEDDAKKWLKLYEEETNTKYIVTDPMSAQPKRYIFHKKWACQLSSYNKSKKKETKRNLKCPGAVDILVKKLTPDTKKNDAFLKRETPLQGLIKIQEHNHEINVCEALGYLRISPEVRQIFEDYFNNGHGPGESIAMHETKMMLEEDGFIKLANSSINPKPRTVYYIHDLWRTTEFGKVWTMKTPLDVLETKIAGYKESGVEVNINKTEDESRWCVTVVTPIMKRAQSLRESSEIIFVDSTSSCDAEQTTITLALTATKGGGVPIAALLHNRQDEPAYTFAFRSLQEHYPNCFGGKPAPEIFMTDNSPAEKSGLRNVWPSAQQYLCHFHVGQQEWRWLTELKNKVPINERQYLMALFQEMMYAVDTESFETAREEFMEKCSHAQYKKRVEKFLDRKEEWAKVYRKDLLSRGHHTNNYVEASIRILKDIILCRTKAYNAVALVAFVGNVWEDYFRKKLLHYAYQRENRPMRMYNKLCQKLSPELGSKVQRLSEDMFMVPSSKTGELTYEVNSSVGWCSCPAGCDGAFCKHQTLVHEVFGVGLPNLPPIDCQGRYQLALLALAEKSPPLEFFIGLKETVTEEMMESIKENCAIPITGPPNMDIDLSQDEAATLNDNVAATLENEAVEEARSEERNKEADELYKGVVEELNRIHQLAKEVTGDVYTRNLKKMLGRLRCRSTPNQSIDLVMRLNAAASTNMNKGKRIKIQPTGIARRKEGKSRGCKRIPAGRPPIGDPPTKKPKHSLSQSIRLNKTHAKAHGH